VGLDNTLTKEVKACQTNSVNQRGLGALPIFILILLVLVVGAIFYRYNNNTANLEGREAYNSSSQDFKEVDKSFLTDRENRKKPVTKLDSNQDNPKIIRVSKFSDEEFEIDLSTFYKTMWLCIQQDFYTKPDNLNCNKSGELISAKNHLFANIGNEAAFRLYSDYTMQTLYDEVLVKELDTKTPKITKLGNICGTLKNSSQPSGGFVIEKTQLLLAEGAQDRLTPLIDKAVCAQGDIDPLKGRLRVYFIENAAP
jgi:hypothetical protein